MERDCFDFVPLRGMKWEDLLKWILQSAPECWTFVHSVSGAFNGLFSGQLPTASLDERYVIFTWHLPNRTFIVKMKHHLVQSKCVNIEWSVLDRKSSLIAEGRSESAYWLPLELEKSFISNIHATREFESAVFHLAVAAIITTTIFVGLSLLN